MSKPIYIYVTVIKIHPSNRDIIRRCSDHNPHPRRLRCYDHTAHPLAAVTSTIRTPQPPLSFDPFPPLFPIHCPSSCHSRFVIFYESIASFRRNHPCHGEMTQHPREQHPTPTPFLNLDLSQSVIPPKNCRLVAVQPASRERPKLRASRYEIFFHFLSRFSIVCGVPQASQVAGIRI